MNLSYLLSFSPFFQIVECKTTVKRKGHWDFKPKKDQCDMCMAFMLKNLTEEEYFDHTLKKEETRMEKNSDKTKECSGVIVVTTHEPESTLLCLKIRASPLDYKR
ncbi:hypothetical protein QYM36_001111 [Artemia franciscana]|uniref:Uncharacterized protein n=1 Tax=Artemia franciscana TaxID=6661 RepID=A0AA88I8G4_ARTSF|nr:hypothetical protein QYM36_001111 [Artemia franciscana]